MRITCLRVYTTTLLLATGFCSNISYGAVCTGDTISSDCTAAPGNTGYVFFDTATLTINGQDIGNAGIPAQSLTLSSGVTGSLSFLTGQTVTGLTSGVTDSSLMINIPSSLTATFDASASAGKVLISGDGTLNLTNNIDSTISGLYASTYDGSDATLTLENTVVTVIDNSSSVNLGSGLMATTCNNGSAIIVLGSGDVTATTLNNNAQFGGITALSSASVPGKGNATILGGSGTVNTFELGAYVFTGTGTASVLLQSGTINAAYLYAQNGNTGDAIINTGSATVNLNGNMYALSSNGNISITLGTAPTTIVGGLYAQSGQDASIITGGGLLTANYVSSSVVGSNNTASLNFQGPAAISGDIGVYNTNTANIGFGKLTVGQNPVTANTIFISPIGGQPLNANDITIGLGGLTVGSQGFTLRNTDTLTFDLGATIPTNPLLNFTNVGGNTFSLNSGSIVSAQNLAFATQTVVLAQAPAGLTSANGVNYIDVPGFTTNWFHTNNQLLLSLIYTGSNIANNANRSNTIGIGTALSQMNLNQLSGQLLEIFNSINLASSDTNALNNALAATAPLVDNSVLAIWYQQEELNNFLLRNKMTPPLSSSAQGYSSGDAQGSNRVWAMLLGSHLNQQMRKQIPGYRGNVGGIVVGGETIAENGYIGIAADLSTLSLDAKVSPSTTHVNHYALDLYGHIDELFGPLFVEGILAGGYNHYHGKRNVAFGSVAISPQSKFNGWQVDTLGRVGVNYETHFVNITPQLIAKYDHLSTTPYSETGAGTANQSVNGADYDQFLMGAGINLEQTWECEQVNVQPKLYTSYLYALKNSTMQTSSQFAGAGPSFVTTGATPPRSQYHLGAELTLVSPKNWDTTFSYDAQIQNDFLAQSGFVRWRYRW